MRAKVATTCGVCGWAMVRVTEKDVMSPVWCVSKDCTEHHRKYEAPTVELIPVHAKGK